MKVRETLIPLLILAALGLALRSVPLLALSLPLLLVVGVADFWGRRSLAAVSYQRRISPQRVFPGEPVQLELTWENRKWLPLAWLEAADEVPEGFDFPHGFATGHHRPRRQWLTNLLPLGFYERVTRRFTLTAPRRGYYVFGPGRLRSGDVFGLVTRQRDEAESQELLVYPRVLPPEAFGLPTLRPLGHHRSGPPFFEDPSRLAGCRDYQDGDPLGRVHWKATAHTGRLQVKLFEPSTSLSLGLFLNCATYEYAWQGIEPALLEQVIEVAAALAVDALDHGHQLGLYGNGLLPGLGTGLRLAPASGPAQLQKVLELLARALPFGGERLADLLAWEGRRLPWGAAVVLVTAIVTEEMQVALEDLRRHGHPVALVAVGAQIPADFQPEGWTVHRVPPAPETAASAEARPDGAAADEEVVAGGH